MLYGVKQGRLGCGGLGLTPQPTCSYLEVSAHPLVQPQGLFVKSTLADR